MIKVLGHTVFPVCPRSSEVVIKFKSFDLDPILLFLDWDNI